MDTLTLKRKLEVTSDEMPSKKRKHNFCALIDCTDCQKKLDKKKMGVCGKCSLLFCFDCLQECDENHLIISTLGLEIDVIFVKNRYVKNVEFIVNNVANILMEERIFII